jgi:hypothetical protein
MSLMQIRLYENIRIPANAPSGSAEINIPQGNWRVVSLVAVATVAGNVVTTDVETVLTTLNQVDRLRATESGAVQLFIFGGPLVTTATKKVALADVLVFVIITLEQS